MPDSGQYIYVHFTCLFLNDVRIEAAQGCDVQHNTRYKFYVCCRCRPSGARDMMNSGSVAVPRHRLTRLSLETHMSRGDMTTLARLADDLSLRRRRMSLYLTRSLFCECVRLYGVRRIVRTWLLHDMVRTCK
jgi:hypothetical protein